MGHLNFTPKVFLPFDDNHPF